MEAIKSTRAELEAVKERKAEWEWEATEAAADETAGDGADDGEKTRTARSTRPTGSRAPRSRSRSPDDWYDRFRWFHTSTGYLVIGGRNADQNEELVKKYMGKHDRFFHTQAHGAR